MSVIYYLFHVYFLGIDLLQDIPLDAAITETTDQGKPIVVALPNSTQVKQIEFSQDLVQILNYSVIFVMFSLMVCLLMGILGL